MSPTAHNIVKAIIKIESNDNFHARGASGEKGRTQFMPTTWDMWSKDIAGRVLPFTEVNEYYVAVMKVDAWLRLGYTEREIGLMWNQGSRGACRQGVNKYGVAYNSCAYADKLLAYLQ